MKGTMLVTTLVLTLPSLAMAHVSVRPRESRPGAEEQYTVRVPTEGAVATTHVVLEIPPDVTVLEVLSADGATVETGKRADRISDITWRKDIPPKQFAEFVFRARNPASGDIVWKAHQHFADGTVAAWVGPAGDRRPAAVTRLTGGAGAGARLATDEADAITASLDGHDIGDGFDRGISVGSGHVTCPIADSNTRVEADHGRIRAAARVGGTRGWEFSPRAARFIADPSRAHICARTAVDTWDTARAT
jgi:uncharacterized protein YcnI